MEQKNKNLRKIVLSNPKIIFILIFLVLFAITLLTQSIGSADEGSFTSPAKYFAGEYDAKIRNSHSYLWGFVNAPFVMIFNSFIGFKILNLIILFLIIYSVYFISGKDKRALFLMLLSPIIWYIAPWINSLQIASLLFLWSYYFISKYNESNKINYLIYSGILFGLIACVWHAILFFGVFFILIFFYNKKTSQAIYYLIAILIGLTPLFLLDFYLFGFPFHSILKNTFGSLLNLFSLGLNPDIGAKKSLIAYLALFLMIPIYFWKLYKKENFMKNAKIMIFLTIVLLVIAKNPQIRYLLLITPIIILNLTKTLNKKQFKRLLIFSAIISLIVVIPYVIQIKYDTNAEEFKSFLENSLTFKFSINSDFPKEIIKQDLDKLSKDYPNKIFIVGNQADDYAVLANLYWGEDINEFISIEDYNLFLQNTSILLKKEFSSGPKNINGRRTIWIKGGISKPNNDPTDYDSINYAISLEDDLDLEDFELIKKYQTLSLFEKA